MTVNDWAAGLRRRAGRDLRHVVLPEGAEPRTMEAAGRATRQGVARVTLLGEERDIRADARRLGIDLGHAQVRPIVTKGPEAKAQLRVYRERMAPRGLTEDEARHHLEDPLLQASLEVALGRYDGLVAGAVRPFKDVLRAVFRGIGLRPGVRRSSSFTLMVGGAGEQGPGSLFLFADCAVNPAPSAPDLAEIAILTAEGARSFLDGPPRVALLSFSTRASADHPRARKVAEAASIVRARAPHLVTDGELQVDAALVAEVAMRKAPTSPVGGRANVLVFPDLESAHIGCQVVEGLGGARALGPILQGLSHPAGGLSSGCHADDIVDVIAATALLATANPGWPGRTRW
jgi:phosphate acetyltransferase